MTSVDVPLTDPAIGGSAAIGSRSVYVQWRDVAGNWSHVVTVQRLEQAGTGRFSVSGADPRA